MHISTTKFFYLESCIFMDSFFDRLLRLNFNFAIKPIKLHVSNNLTSKVWVIIK